MNSSVHFSTFDPLRDAPEICGVCTLAAPILRYEFETGDESGEPYVIKGYCCEGCAIRLLKVLECSESREWAEEESAMAAADMDTSEVRKRLEGLRLVLVG